MQNKPSNILLPEDDVLKYERDMNPSSRVSASPVTGLNPATVPALVAALKTCTRLKDLDTGRRIHSDVVHSQGDNLHIFVANTLIDMYSKCSTMAEARKVFDRLGNSRTIVTWNALLMGYVINGQAETALNMFSRMRHQGFAPDGRTFNAMLKALASLLDGRTSDGGRWLNKVAEIRAAVSETGYESDIFVASTLVRVYAKCGDLLEARDVFGRMAEHDTVSWTALITGYVQAGENAAALGLFSEMLEEGLSSPDCQTFAAVLKACGNLAAREDTSDGEKMVYLEKGIAIHSEIKKCGVRDMFLESSLVDMYAKCDCMTDARRVFERMRRKDVVAWNSMLMGYAQGGETENALELFENMSDFKEVQPDSRTFISVFKACGSHPCIDEDEEIRRWCLEKGRAIHHSQVAGTDYESVIRLLSSLVDMYGKCRSLPEAKEVFDRIENRDVVSWNAMISGCVNCGESELAVRFYSRMIEEDRLSPDDGTFAAVLKASLAGIKAGVRLHSDVVRYGVEDHVLVMTYLVELNGKDSSSMARARRVFESARVESRNMVTWNALLAGYTRHGDHGQVFELVEMMKTEGVELTGMSYLCILNACSHAGLVDRGKRYFEEMKGNAAVEHYACMVDLLGRVNQLDDALEMIHGMENGNGSERMIWMTFLSWCEKWKNVPYGRVAFRKLLKLNGSENNLSAAYVLMANTFS